MSDTIDEIEEIDEVNEIKTKTEIIRFDWAIKTVLRQKKNFNILEGFLSELLREDIKIIELLESESNDDHKYSKINRVDLLVKTEDNQRIIIEVQCDRQYDFLQRALFGVSKTIADSINKGGQYSEVSKVISVNILFFDLGQGTDYIYVGNTEFKGLHDNSKLHLSPR